MTSTSPFDSWPLPVYQLNRKLEIIEYSEKAESMFGESELFVELLDEGSVSKARDFLLSARFSEPIELNFKTASDELMLCDIHCKWDSESLLNVVVVPKDNQVEKISAQLSSLRYRLNETNYDLLLEKERTEKLLQRVRELSAPTIELGIGLLLIPFFGDLDAGKIESVKSQILEDVYEKHAETVILDLTAMDEINSDGMDFLNSLLQTFKVMGVAAIVTGVKPNHAKQLHALRTSVDMHFEASLATVLAERRLII